MHDKDAVSSQANNKISYIRKTDATEIAKWMTERSMKDYETMIPVKFYGGEIWCRISGQIYLPDTSNRSTGLFLH